MSKYNSEKITLEAVQKTEKLAKLYQQQASTMEQLRISLLYQAIKDNVVEVVTTRNKRGMPTSSTVVWPVRTNHVGETVQDMMPLTVDEYKQLVDDRYVVRLTHYEQRAMRKAFEIAIKHSLHGYGIPIKEGT